MKKIGFLLITITLLISVGCGDSGNFFESIENKNSSEAKEFEASKQVDEGNYPAILNNPDDYNASDYAIAAMSAAGLNPLDIVENMLDEQDQDFMAQVTTLSINPEYLDELQTAKQKLSEEMNCPDGPKCTDPELNLRMAFTSLASVVTALGQVGENNEINVKNGITQEDADAIAPYIIANPMIDTDKEPGGDTPLLELVIEDVGNITSSILYIATGEEDIDNSLDNISQGEGSINYDGAGDVTANDISKYMKCEIGTGGEGCQD